MKKVGVILVNYNGEVYIRDCIDSLLAQTYKNLEILFWDNHSKDASVETVRKMYPKIHLIESPHNYGFAKANNLAVKRLLQMGVEYVLLLNVDTVADSCLIEYLLEKADNRTVTTAQIYMDRKGRKIWYAGGELQFNTGKSKHLQLKTKKEEKVSGHAPSVDVMFDSVATTAGRNAVGVILTGMGADGAKGITKLHSTGAYTIGQDKDSCVVYGMPMEAYRAGAVCTQSALSSIPQVVMAQLAKS